MENRKHDQRGERKPGGSLDSETKEKKKMCTWQIKKRSVKCI